MSLRNLFEFIFYPALEIQFHSILKSKRFWVDGKNSVDFSSYRENQLRAGSYAAVYGKVVL